MYLLGLDFLCSGGEFYFLEANDHADGVALAADFLDVHHCHWRSNLSAFCDDIADAAQGGAVGYLLPDRYSDPIEACGAEIDFVASALELEEVKIRDLVWWREELQLRGAKFVLLGKAALADETWARSSSGMVFGVLIRRVVSTPESIDPQTINDVRLRRICVDKVLTSNIVRQLSDVNVVPVFLRLEEGLEFDFDQWCICKPRYGEASQGVQRVLGAPAHPATYDADEGYREIVQPWVKPDCIFLSSNAYCFDVRIFVTQRGVIGGVVRRAAAPTNGPFKDSPLAWLTTTGPLGPLSAATSPVFGASRLAALDEVAQRIGHLLYREALNLTVPSTMSWLRKILPETPRLVSHS